MAPANVTNSVQKNYPNKLDENHQKYTVLCKGLEQLDVEILIHHTVSSVRYLSQNHCTADQHTHTFSYNELFLPIKRTRWYAPHINI